MNDEKEITTTDSNVVTIETPTGKQLVLRKSFTARQRNELRNVYLQHLKVNPAGGSAPEVGEISGEIVGIAEGKLIELAVISYDGVTENVYDLLLDSTPAEYDFVVTEAGKVNTGFLAQTN